MTRIAQRKGGFRYRKSSFLKPKPIAGLGLFLAGCLGFLLGAYFLKGALVPLALAWLFAYLLYPLTLWLQSKKIGKKTAIWSVYLGTVFLLGLIVFWVVPRLIFEGILFLQHLPVILKSMLDQIQSFILGLKIPGLEASHLKALFQRQIATVSFGTASGFSAVINDMGSQLLDVLLSVANYALFPIFFYYFLSDFEQLHSFFISWIPGVWKQKVTGFLEITSRVLSGYVRGQIMVACVLAVLYGLGLSLVGLKYGAVIGIITGLLNVVPYFGFAVGIFSGGLIALFSGHGLSHLLLVLSVFLVVQMLESFVLTPRIVGYQVGLNPFLAMIALIVGGNCLGFFGMLIAIPVAAILKIGYDTWMTKELL